MRTLAALLVAFVALTGAGIRASSGPERNTEQFSVYYISDVHYQNPVGGRIYGAAMFRDMIDHIKVDDDAVGLILGGDCPYRESEDQGSYFDDAIRDTLYALVTDTLHAHGKRIFPTIGNHDEYWEDLNTGNIFDRFGQEFDGSPSGPFYDTYKSTDQRGRRWYGLRIPYKGKTTNILLFSVNNTANADADSSWYINENPYASSFQYGDFDGIKNSTSTQRRDLLKFVQDNRGPGDWVFVTGHRSIHKLALAVTRPELEGVKIDSGYVKILDDEIDSRWLVLQGDTHYNALLTPISTGTGPGHYTLDSAMMSRPTVPDSFAAYASNIVFAHGYDRANDYIQNPDTTYCGGCALEDSIGTTSDSAPLALAPNVGFSLLWRLDVRGPEIDVVALYFVYGRSTPTEVFSYTLTL